MKNFAICKKKEENLKKNCSNSELEASSRHKVATIKFPTSLSCSNRPSTSDRRLKKYYNFKEKLKKLKKKTIIICKKKINKKYTKK